MKYTELHLRYLGRLLWIVFTLPLLFIHGKRIRKSVPVLGEAKNPNGTVKGNGDRDRILFIGESTMAGVGVSEHKQGFPGHFARKWSEVSGRSVNWDVVARSGYTVDRVVKKSMKHVPKEEVDLIVIGLGGNDGFGLTPTWRWIKGLDRLRNALSEKYPDVPIAFANMPPIRDFPAFTSLIKTVIGGQVDLLGESLERWVADQENVHFYSDKITLTGWCRRYGYPEDPALFFSDGVHPSELTYQVWSESMASWLHEGRAKV